MLFHENGVLMTFFEIADYGPTVNPVLQQFQRARTNQKLRASYDKTKLPFKARSLLNIEYVGWNSPLPKQWLSSEGYIFIMPIHIQSDERLKVGDIRLKIEVGKVYAFDSSLPCSTIGSGEVTVACLGPFKKEDLTENKILDIAHEFKKYCYV